MRSKKVMSYVVYVVHGRCSPNWTLERNLYGPFHTLMEPVTYVTHQISRKYLDRGQRYAPKVKFETKPSVYMYKIPLMIVSEVLQGLMQYNAIAGCSKKIQMLFI